jgi:hypothetical protein
MFVRNEILLSRCDYSYFTRYVKILLDDETGEEGSLDLWSAQRRLIRKVGDVEKRLFDEVDAGRKRLDGNCWFVHKRRQTGASTIAQSMGVHRTALWSNMNGLTAGVDETSTLTKLYNKYYYFMLQRLPRWMQVGRVSDSNEGIEFVNGSSVILQNSTGANVGQGAKWHWAHLTECAAWDKNKVSDQIDNHFTNAISASVKGMAFLESTSQGIDDWWHHSTELARRSQLPRWNYFFVPWYAIEEISIAYPPDDWKPNAETLKHAQYVERTSPEFMDGQTYRLTPNQMYFWERTRSTFEVKGDLANFYKNYPATPEESFVVTGRTSFPIEVITYYSDQVREPWAYYDILGRGTESSRVITEPKYRADGSRVDPPPIRKFGSIEIGPVQTTEDERRHPLGLMRIFENPDDVRPFDTFISADTADGLANWTRFTHRREDDKPDRAAIQVTRQSRVRDGSVLDVQIGEFFAPISALDQAPYVVAMGMLLHGRNAIEQQPPLMTELTGTGKILNTELENRYGWFHFYQDFKFNGLEWEETSKFGWTPDKYTTRQLWISGKQRMVDRRVIIRSQPLVNEMKICQDDGIYMSILMRFTRGKAKEGSGQHDDLVYTFMFNLWQANLFALTPAGSTVAPVHMTVGAPPGAAVKLRDLMPGERAQFLAELDNRLLGG